MKGRSHPRPHVSPALVVASLALAVSLGGTSYAALRLPPNTVGTAHLKTNAVTSPKVKNGTLGLADFARSERAKLKGDKGDGGDPGTKGDKGDKGDPGPVGVSGHERIVGTLVNVSPGGIQQATAACPSGKRVLGGGVVMENIDGAVIVASLPQPNVAAWLALVRNTAAVKISVQALAVCANVGP